MINRDWVLLLYAIYVPPLIIMYLLELIAILKHRKQFFNSSFYNIFGVLAVEIIAACIFAWFVFRLPLYPIVNRIYASLTDSSTYYLNFLSEFLGEFLAINRFTALHFPIRHLQFWRQKLFVGLPVCIIISFPPVGHLLAHSTAFAESASIWLNMVIVMVVCNSLSSLFYGACLIRLCLFSTTRHHKVERNFFLVGFLTMLFSLPYMTAMVSHLNNS
ncbi:hypothetical protein PENTCL1PPCAC_9748 [Pristionchus entomophagus]|uniref:Serpentine receptor class gamma n=1 Tax=Pristionchus entomophagus TaxID=358040 RepID=A0AAV5SWS2_9BILA|nr:hypothetical protein PENTCL1PPCAC_9748 [Pristionchus entomophagus]